MSSIENIITNPSVWLTPFLSAIITLFVNGTFKKKYFFNDFLLVQDQFPQNKKTVCFFFEDYFDAKFSWSEIQHIMSCPCSYIYFKNLRNASPYIKFNNVTKKYQYKNDTLAIRALSIHVLIIFSVVAYLLFIIYEKISSGQINAFYALLFSIGLPFSGFAITKATIILADCNSAKNIITEEIRQTN